MQNIQLNTGQKEYAPGAANTRDVSTLANASLVAASARPLKDISKYSTAGEGFQDVISDLNSDWRSRKLSSLFLADTYRYLSRLFFEGNLSTPDRLRYVPLPNGVRPYVRYERVRECATYLEFSGPARDSLHLTHANFCRDRFCPQCSKRRSLKIFSQTSAVMDYLQEHFPGYQYIFITLTVRNCSSEMLADTIDLIQAGWRWLYNDSGYFRRKHKYDPAPSFMGSFRTLEVKRADDGVNWHPHLHVICAVPSSYFRSDRYLDHSGLVKLWRRACQLDYDPWVFIEACTPVSDPDVPGMSYRAAVAEVSKYIAKSKDYLFPGDLSRSAQSLLSLLLSLHNRRLCSYTGCFLKARRELALDDPESGDLVNIDTQLRPDVVDLVFKFGWRCGVYVLLDDYDQVKD